MWYGYSPTHSIVKVYKLIVMDELLQSKGYEVENTIGEGTYSKVKRAYCNTRGRHVAIKIIDTSKGPKGKSEQYCSTGMYSYGYVVYW